MDIWKARYMGKWYLPPDCNSCKHLNITEKEQETGVKRGNHICIYYSQRVKHRASRKEHDPFIYPCKECDDDQYVNYEPRKEVYVRG